MNKKLACALLILGAALALSSCSSSDENNGPTASVTISGGSN